MFSAPRAQRLQRGAMGQTPGGAQVEKSETYRKRFENFENVQNNLQRAQTASEVVRTNEVKHMQQRKEQFRERSARCPRARRALVYGGVLLTSHPASHPASHGDMAENVENPKLFEKSENVPNLLKRAQNA